LNELIAERAYDVYQRRERNGAPGDSHSDWVQAEKEVTEELKKKEAAAKSKAPESKPAPAAPKVEAKAEVKEPPKPAAPKAEEKAPPKVEPKPAAPAPAPAPASTVKTVVAKKTVKK
jgi:hypothetical protein